MRKWRSQSVVAPRYCTRMVHEVCSHREGPGGAAARACYLRDILDAQTRSSSSRSGWASSTCGLRRYLRRRSVCITFLLRGRLSGEEPRVLVSPAAHAPASVKDGLLPQEQRPSRSWLNAARRRARHRQVAADAQNALCKLSLIHI